jgi:hypothetical protein
MTRENPTRLTLRRRGGLLDGATHFGRGVRVMKRAELLCTGMVAAAIVAMGSVTAHAEIITLEVSGTLSPRPAQPFEPPAESCASTGCTLGGEIIINNVTGAVLSADVTATGFSPSVGPFTDPQPPHTNERLTDLEITTAPVFTSEVALVFSTPMEGSLVGYAGGPLSTITNDVSSQTGAFGWNLTAGSLRETVVVPEPSTWAMMLLGFVGLGFAGYRASRKSAAVAA